MRRYIFIILLVIGGFLGLPWAVQPIIRPPQGLMATDWTYIQLIQDRYPFHLISPAWVSDEFAWCGAETAARLGIVAAFIIICIYFLVRGRSKKSD